MAKRAGTRRPDGFDGAAAVTRSLLGYGVVAGPFYLGVGLLLAFTREGFDLARHPLSLLMLGEHGWMQRVNLGLTGAMAIAAAIGFARALRGSSAGPRAAALLGVYGVALVLSAIFPPDPMEGFPPGATGGEASTAGILHLAFGAVGFLALASAALILASWFARNPAGAWSGVSRLAAALILAGFVGGAALATSSAGVALLWLAVVVGWAWLAGTSVHLYHSVPHPDPHRREPTSA